jgi:hypothetical protein
MVEATMRYFLVLPLLVGCSSGAAFIDDPDYSTNIDDPFEPDVPDYSEYDSVEMRIVNPKSGDYLAWGEPHDFEAKLRNDDGEFIEYDEIAWTSSVDSTWMRAGQVFEDDQLDVGIHDLTAQARLPNGDRLSHTIGGLLVQSRYSGTYAGLFSVDVDYDALIVTCSGSALLLMDPYGEVAAGEGDCLVSMLGLDLPLSFIFDLDNDEGEITGKAGADIFGWFTYDFDAVGTLEPLGKGFDIAFGGNALGIVGIDAVLDAERVSLDSGL